MIDKFSDSSFAAQIKPRSLFTDVFDRHLLGHLHSVRANKNGNDANLKLVDDFGKPDVLWRLKTARLNFRIGLDRIAEQLKNGLRKNYSVKYIESVEDGKQRLSIREMTVWIHFLKTFGMSEAWLWSGKGEMYLPLGINFGASPLEMFDNRAGLIRAVQSLREQAQSLSDGLRAVEVRLVKEEQAEKPPASDVEKLKKK